MNLKNTRCLLDDGNQHKAGISKVSMKRTLKRSNLEVGMNLSLRFLVCALSSLTLTQAALAPRNCANTPNYFEPGKDTDGQRYPLAMGPLAWHLIGSGVYPVEGSDGRIHVAFAFLFTSPWRLPTTIQSVEAVPVYLGLPARPPETLSLVTCEYCVRFYCGQRTGVP